MAEPRHITGIDHPIIAVRDMARGRAAYEHLGFTVTPRGRHREWGTGNWCIMFEKDYLELRGIIDSATQNPAHRLPDQDGLMGIALGTNDAEASHAALTHRDLHPQPVKRLTRDFELPEGAVQPRFSLCFLEAVDTPGLMSVVLCQHLTPGLLRRPEWLRHENGARGIQKVIGMVPDVATAADSHAKLFGAQSIDRESNRLTIHVGRNQTIELMTPNAARNTWFANDSRLSDVGGRLLSITIEVNDANGTEGYFASSGVEFRRSSAGSLQVASREACGVPLEFTDRT